MKAKEFIEISLLATLPPGVPPFFTKIIRAYWETKSAAKHRCAQALLELLDGKQAGIEVWEHGAGGIAYQWTSFEGDLSYENGQWVRREETCVGGASHPRDESPPPEGKTGLATEMQRCPICEWPLAENAEKGCLPNDCSYRPGEGSEEYRRIQRRKEALAEAA